MITENERGELVSNLVERSVSELPETSAMGDKLFQIIDLAVRGEITADIINNLKTAGMEVLGRVVAEFSEGVKMLSAEQARHSYELGREL